MFSLFLKTPMHQYLGTLHWKSKTFKWIYNKNATHKWIPNLFKEHNIYLFQSSMYLHTCTEYEGIKGQFLMENRCIWIVYTNTLYTVLCNIEKFVTTPYSSPLHLVYTCELCNVYTWFEIVSFSPKTKG